MASKTKERDGASTSESGGQTMQQESAHELTAESQHAKMGEERAFLTKLLEAALRGEGEKVKTVSQDYAASHNITPHEVLSQFKDGHKRTAIHFACTSLPSEDVLKKEGADIVEVLLLKNWLPQAAVESMLRIKDDNGLTPLMLAAQLSQHDPDLSRRRIEMLFQAVGPKLALARSRAGATPLHYAAGAGASRDAIVCLHQNGTVAIRTSSTKGGTPLHWAAGKIAKQTRETILALVDDCGADVSAKDENGMTALVMAAAANNDAAAKALVQRGADRAQILPGNVTIYHMAADLNLVGTLAALLDPLDDQTDSEQTVTYLEKQNDLGETPLDLAAQEGHLGCVMLLLPDGHNSEEEAKAYIKKVQAQKKDTSQAPRSTKPAVQDNDDKEKDTPLDKSEEEAKQVASRAMAKTGQVSEADKEKALECKVRGNAFFVKNEWQAAIEAYTEAIAKNPTEATFYSNRSASYIGKAHNNGAEDVSTLEAALIDAVVARHLKPDWPKACFRLAVARMELGRYEDAAVAAWEGIQMDTGDPSDELKRLLQKCVKKGKKVHQEQVSQKKDQSKKGPKQ